MAGHALRFAVGRGQRILASARQALTMVVTMTTARLLRGPRLVNVHRHHHHHHHSVTASRDAAPSKCSVRRSLNTCWSRVNTDYGRLPWASRYWSGNSVVASIAPRVSRRREVVIDENDDRWRCWWSLCGGGGGTELSEESGSDSRTVITEPNNNKYSRWTLNLERDLFVNIWGTKITCIIRLILSRIT